MYKCSSMCYVYMAFGDTACDKHYQFLIQLYTHLCYSYTDDDVTSHAKDINSLQLFLHSVVEIWTKVDDQLKEK